MKDYVILTDSCVDLTSEMVKEMGVEVIPLSINLGDKVYYNYLDEREITSKDFYQLLRDKKMPTTSQISPQSFLDFIEPFIQAGKDILSISFSSALSGTFQSSVIAREELLEKYPYQKIITIDSLCASMGQGLLVKYASDLRKEGKTIEEVATWVESNRTKVSHLFTVGDLNHLRRGGRLSYGRALLGSILMIKPLLHVNEEGKLVQTGIARGRKTSLKRMVERLAKTIDNPDQVVYISHGDCLDDVLLFKEMLLEKVKVKDIVINYVGPVIGSHSGLDTIAVFYLGNDRFLKNEDI